MQTTFPFPGNTNVIRSGYGQFRYLINISVLCMHKLLLVLLGKWLHPMFVLADACRTWFQQNPVWKETQFVKHCKTIYFIYKQVKLLSVTCSGINLFKIGKKFKNNFSHLLIFRVFSLYAEAGRKYEQTLLQVTDLPLHKIPINPPSLKTFTLDLNKLQL